MIYLDMQFCSIKKLFNKLGIGISFFALFFLSQIMESDAAAIKISEFMNSIEEKKSELQGGAIAILHKGKVVYKTTFGNQKGYKDPVTTTTLFPLASVSKPVSSIALALLTEEGLLNLEEEVTLPYLKPKINFKHILSHTTGYNFSGNDQIEKGIRRQKLLDELKYLKPKAEPGMSYFYSNTMYSLIDEALKMKGLSFPYSIQKLKTTLNMNGIQILPLDSTAIVAHPHVKQSNKRIMLPLPPYYPKTTPASAGVFASLDGMIEFFKLSFGYRPDLISKEILNEIHTPITSNRDIDKWPINWPINKKDLESHYGLGWRILNTKDRSKERLIFHTGYLDGVGAFIGFIPAKDIGIIIMVNQSSRFHLESGIKFWTHFIK